MPTFPGNPHIGYFHGRRYHWKSLAVRKLESSLLVENTIINPEFTADGKVEGTAGCLILKEACYRNN